MSGEYVFNGFSKESIQFLLDLKSNNNREWFHEHKQDFEAYIMGPSRAFVVAMGTKLTSIAPDIHAEPKTDRSIFRIYRDTRFSPDKSPYKSNIAMWFWEGEGKRMENPGFYFHLEPPNLLLGSGIHTFPKPLLDKYRQAVDNQGQGKELEMAISAVLEKGEYSIGGEHYKRVPRGYDSDHKRASLLRYNGLTIGVDELIPDELYSNSLIDYCFQRYQEMLPIHHWLLQLTGNGSEQ